MNKKNLYAGLLLLFIGITLKIVTLQTLLSRIFIFSGVILKIIYVFSTIKRGKYKPGIELLFLGIGLSLFILGSNTEFLGWNINPIFLITSGIALKITFIFLFIRKIRRN